MYGTGPAIDLQKMPILAKKIIFSYEAYFDFGSCVNNQNCRIWGTENPQANIERLTKDPKRVTVTHTYIQNWSLEPFSRDY